MKTGSCYIFENLEFCWSFLEFMYSLICSTDISRAPTLCQMGQATVGCKGVPLRRLWCRGATKASTAKTVGPREYEKGCLPRWKEHSENSSWWRVCDSARELMHQLTGKYKWRGPAGSSVEISSSSITDWIRSYRENYVILHLLWFNGVFLKATF